MLTRCQVPVRLTFPRQEIVYVNALASIRSQGHTFLVHRLDDGYTATFAPTGLSISGLFGIGVQRDPLLRNASFVSIWTPFQVCVSMIMGIGY